MQPEQQWPSVDLAYELVIPSYSWLQQRLDAVDSRIQTLQAFTATVTLGAPVLAAAIAKDINLRSPLFLVAVAIFVGIVIAGAIARVWGNIRLISPKKIYAGWLHHSEWEFKRRAIYFAGEDYAANRSLINAKGNVALGMSAGFLIETGLLLAWVLKEI